MHTRKKRSEKKKKAYAILWSALLKRPLCSLLIRAIKNLISLHSGVCLTAVSWWNELNCTCFFLMTIGCSLPFTTTILSTRYKVTLTCLNTRCDTVHYTRSGEWFQAQSSDRPCDGLVVCHVSCVPHLAVGCNPPTFAPTPAHHHWKTQIKTLLFTRKHPVTPYLVYYEFLLWKHRRVTWPHSDWLVALVVFQF